MKKYLRCIAGLLALNFYLLPVTYAQFETSTADISETAGDNDNETSGFEEGEGAIETAIEVVTVPSDTIYQIDTTLEPGREMVLQKGTPGRAEYVIKYLVTLNGRSLQSRELRSVIEQAVPTIIAYNPNKPTTVTTAEAITTRESTETTIRTTVATTSETKTTAESNTSLSTKESSGTSEKLMSSQENREDASAIGGNVGNRTTTMTTKEKAAKEKSESEKKSDKKQKKEEKRLPETGEKADALLLPLQGLTMMVVGLGLTKQKGQ